MQLFFHNCLDHNTITLSQEESRHCVKSLRKHAGDEIFLTDGKGTLAKGHILSDVLDGCVVELIDKQINFHQRSVSLHLAVAPTKNPDRMEWLVEKATEIGIETITFIICDHSERLHIDLKRMERIAIAALKQSNTTYLPKIDCRPFIDFMKRQQESNCAKYIAWCDDENSNEFSDHIQNKTDIVLLIGPEGDFSDGEIVEAKQQGYVEVKLGKRRLRTETAALYACCIAADAERRF